MSGEDKNVKSGNIQPLSFPSLRIFLDLRYFEKTSALLPVLYKVFRDYGLGPVVHTQDVVPLRRVLQVVVIDGQVLGVDSVFPERVGTKRGVIVEEETLQRYSGPEDDRSTVHVVTNQVEEKLLGCSFQGVPLSNDHFSQQVAHAHRDFRFCFPHGMVEMNRKYFLRAALALAVPDVLDIFQRRSCRVAAFWKVSD